MQYARYISEELKSRAKSNLHTFFGHPQHTPVKFVSLQYVTVSLAQRPAGFQRIGNVAPADTVPRLAISPVAARRLNEWEGEAH